MRRTDLILAVTVALTIVLLVSFAAPARLLGATVPDTVHDAGATGDLIAFGDDVEASQPVAGDVVVINGSARIHEAVAGDVVVISGNVTFSGAGRVAGDLICIGGRVIGGEGRVRGDFFAPGSLNDAFGAAVSGAEKRRLLMLLAVALKLVLLFLWLLAAVVIVLLAGREVRHASVEVRVSPLYTFALGLVAYTSLILTAIVFSALVPFLIGVPLLVLLGVFAIGAKVFGTVAVFHAVGTAVAGARDREQLAGRKFLRGDLALAMVGLLLLGLVRMIPVAGTLAWSVASLFGMGTTLATAFGRREPWFLAVPRRPARPAA